MNYPYIGMDVVTQNKYTLQNAIIRKIELKLIGHFDNRISVMVMTDRAVLFSHADSTRSCGLLIKELFELLGLSDDDGRTLDSVRNVPCRLLIKADEIFGIGHFIKDKFVETPALIHYVNMMIKKED